MKLKIFVLLFFAIYSVSLLNAQCDDCFDKDEDWKLAGGVTLYSNNHYVSDINILERQPLEINLRYKLNGHHILRVSIPFLNKVNKHGEPDVSFPRYPVGEVSLEDYLEALHNQDHDYGSYYKPLNYYESLYGISLGYDYNFPLWKSISVFAGADLACYYYTLRSKYYNISYEGLDENGKSELGLISLWNRNMEKIGYNACPILGVRYQFQKLLFEANIGYAFIKEDCTYTGTILSIGAEGIISGSPYFSQATYYNKNFRYQFSLYYTF